MQVRYATERFLYRMSVSRHANAFLLKGAMLFVLWETHPHRPTRDMDLLFLETHDRRELEAIFREIAAVEVTPDGLRFDTASIHAEEIRENNAYGGIRVKLLAWLGTARIPLQIDIGLGDAVHPEPVWTDFTTLLDFPAPRIRPYPVYSVVAEKFQAMVELGTLNSRMKDYFDVIYLQRHFEFSGEDLQEAMRKTFQRRRTPLPDGLPEGLDEPFWKTPQKQTQWIAFLRKNRLSIEDDLEKICHEIASFALPVIQTTPFLSTWVPGRGWTRQ
ncbi:nucleotidyl transferase AbiEii/AbiGii toxin family protein [Termitidicoccus mucosus]|uniref:Nucleotidyl transferase AbiEii/AbiGii toxin family protein n=1 Tax=Termitidicoccus mucosus TaxID=1184151 RepID=A0A178IIE2_9BACT|nr:hypothetical protein AW736_09030 [Opitutaceae bacterium TSB47]